MPKGVEETSKPPQNIYSAVWFFELKYSSCPTDNIQMEEELIRMLKILSSKSSCLKLFHCIHSTPVTPTQKTQNTKKDIFLICKEWSTSTVVYCESGTD